MAQINFGVKEINPKSALAQKEEALKLYQAQLTDPNGLKLYALKEGLDFAMWMEEEKGAYETVVRNILTLFNDGGNTQQVILTPHTARPDLQLRVLSSFMSSPTMGLAEPEVQDAFKTYREALISFMGQMLPSMVPNPDELENMGMQPQQPQGPQQMQAPQGAM